MNHLITDLTTQKRNRQRVNVFLDGEFAFGLARIVAAWLQTGTEISDEKIASLLAEDERESAYQLAANYINYRPRTKAEVQNHLRNHKVKDETISFVMDHLEANHLINDAQFAQSWVENRTELHPRSRRAISYELKKHGIDTELIETSIDLVNEEDMAYQAARKQARKIDILDWRIFRQKMLRHLALRGFQYEVSMEAAKRVWAETKLNHDEGELENG